MTATYELISTVTVSTATAANIEFTSIPGTYDDLVVKVSAKSSTNTATGIMRLNGSSSNLSGRILYGDGASAASITVTNGSIISLTGENAFTANTFSNAEIYIPNYRSNTNKSASSDAVSENNATTAYAGINAYLWSDTSVVTSITLLPASGSFIQHSSASLYGIKKS